MKKLITCIIAIVLCLAISVSVIGCGREAEEPKDDSISYLNIGIWDGGYRDNWARTWEKRFEQQYANTSFEEGKKGVDIQVSVSKSYLNDTCAQNLNDYEDHIIFNEQANYYEFIRSGTALDITDWVTTPLTEYGENRSIAEKLSAWDKKYYSVSESNPTYYGLPWYCSFLTMSYDIDLFDEENLYFAREGFGDSNGFIQSDDDPLGYGPDGRTGVINGFDYSVDDGMPATYDDFFVLCDRIVDLGYVPFIWAGGFQIYVTELVNTLVADYEGYDNMSLKYTLNGTATDLVNTIEDGIAVLESTPTEITTSNGYLLKKQAGEYYALKFLHRLIATKNELGEPKYYNETDCFSGSMSHTGAQAKFLQSRFSNSTDAIAMFIDGTWWYNEATAVFDAMSGRPGCGQKERRIGIVPTPKATVDKVGEDATWMNTFTTSVVVNSNIPDELKELARTFFRFIHTDEALSSYVADANGIRPFKYELKNVADKDISLFAKSQYNIYKNSKVVNPYDTNYIMQNYLNSIHLNFTTLVNGTDEYSRVTDAFAEGVTAEEYFWGLSNYMTAQRWSRFIPGVQ